MTRPSTIDTELNALFAARRPTKWVTRSRPKIDRIACPWLIRRFIDPDALFLYVPTSDVFDVAERESAIAFDIPGAPFSHVGAACSFDAFIERFDLRHDGLAVVADIVRGADTDRHELAPESAGLHAISIGLSIRYTCDQDMLMQGLILYDALFAWATSGRGERHAWTPAS